MKWFLLLFLSACCLPAADTYRLAGTVVYASTNAPFPQAHVVISKTGSTRAVATMITGGDGRFSFDLPQGKYYLRAGTRDSHQIYGMPRPDASVGSSVFVGPGQDTSQLIFRWFQPAAIGGRVLDGNGDPVENALVQLVRSSVVAGRRVTATAGWAYANDLGEFRFGPLAAGSYYLTANGQPWYARPVLPGQPASHSLPSFRTVHYPNAIDPAHAEALALKQGDDVHVDFTLTEAPGATVTVKYNQIPGFSGTVGLIAEGIGTSDAFQRETRTYASQQVMAGVPPGKYTVRVSGSSANTSMAGHQEIDVNGTDTTVEVSVKPFATFSGRVQFPDMARPTGSLLVALVRENMPGSIATTIHPDGTFSFPAAAAGIYRIVLRTPGYFASAIQVQGTQFQDDILTLDNGQTVTATIAASDEMGSVKGVLTRAQKPVVGSMVVLVPVSEAADRTMYRGFQTDSDGSFNFENVRTGDYLLFASPDADIEYTNRKAVLPFLGQAKPVRIARKAATAQDLVQ